MSLPQGCAFRDNLGYVTDAANDYRILGASDGYYGSNTSTQGNAVGWESATMPGGAAPTRADRSTSVPKLAGINYVWDGLGVTTTDGAAFKIGLTGDILVRIAAGDAGGFDNPCVWDLYDGAVFVAHLTTGSTGTSSLFKDAVDASHTAANWAANNTGKFHTFSTSVRIVAAPGSSVRNIISYVSVETGVAPGGSGKPSYLYNQMRRH